MKWHACTVKPHDILNVKTAPRSLYTASQSIPFTVCFYYSADGSVRNGTVITE